jgi:hypothetical protein
VANAKEKKERQHRGEGAKKAARRERRHKLYEIESKRLTSLVGVALFPMSDEKLAFQARQATDRKLSEERHGKTA